jgi:uncharacterized protein
VAVVQPFRFSPNPNRANEIPWREWGAAALAEASSLDRPVLLHLTAVWCHWCQLMDETTYSDDDVIRLVAAELVPIRVDADRHPHVQDRYIAGGWPTCAFLTPTGEVLWSGTYTEPDRFRNVAAGVLEAWRGRRDDLEREIDRRRRALDAARRREESAGLVRREPADDVLTAIQQAFDGLNGGFGDAPKFPQPEAVELLYAHATEDPGLGPLADHTLDGMLAGELWDAADGGFFRYATRADWTAPRHEKLLDVNAGLLEAYALGAVVRGREDWRAVAGRTVAWAEAVLLLPDGLWAGSQCADAAYFAPGADRSALRAPPVDTTVYTSCNARWAAALALAGARLARPEWVERAAVTFRTLCATMTAPGGGMFHFREPGEAPQLDILLGDTLEALRAALALAQADGAREWVGQARRLAGHLEAAFWAEDGGFWDRARSPEHAVGALRYRERQFEANALAARLLLELAHASGERNWRGLAERALARVGAVAGRYGVAGATFALASADFFEATPAVFVVLPASADGAALAEAAALRAMAFSLPVPRLRVWTVPHGHVTGPHSFAAHGRPAAYVWSRRGVSAAIGTPAELALAGSAAG